MSFLRELKKECLKLNQQNKMSDCIFCKIAKGEIPAKIIAENQDALAFLDIEPKSPGHTLVIPKKHYSDLFGIPEEELKNLFLLVQKSVQILKDRLQAEGFNVGYNHGPVAGQEVMHLHIHILPRYKGDGGRPIQSLVNNQTVDLEEVYKKLKVKLW